jgi:hypothetical protein
MLGREEVVLPCVYSNQIKVITLTSQTIKCVEHRFEADNFDCLELYTFRDTHLLCIKEEDHIEGQLSLTYFAS